MSEILNYNETQVLLIGASQFPDSTISPIPNVVANINSLKAALIDINLIGIPEININISLNESKTTIEKKLRDIALKTRNKENSLIIYYSGHGILSSEEYTLHLTTCQTTQQDLEIEGINIETLKKYIKKSNAGRKIVILDCCHSGAILGTMNNTPSSIQAEIQKIEGTYVITSAAEDMPSLYSLESPDVPTYFTGKFIEILNNGLEIEEEYCSLRGIFNKIDEDFMLLSLPRPQQSNKNRSDELKFARNRKFYSIKSVQFKPFEHRDEKYITFLKIMQQRENSKNKKRNLQSIASLDENELWDQSLKLNAINGFMDYLKAYPKGKYAKEAKESIKNHKHTISRDIWLRVVEKNSLDGYEMYIKENPTGDYVPLAHIKMKEIISGNRLPILPHHQPIRQQNSSSWLFNFIFFCASIALLIIIFYKYK